MILMIISLSPFCFCCHSRCWLPLSTFLRFCHSFLSFTSPSTQSFSISCSLFLFCYLFTVSHLLLFQIPYLHLFFSSVSFSFMFATFSSYFVTFYLTLSLLHSSIPHHPSHSLLHPVCLPLLSLSPLIRYIFVSFFLIFHLVSLIH